MPTRAHTCPCVPTRTHTCPHMLMRAHPFPCVPVDTESRVEDYVKRFVRSATTAWSLYVQDLEPSSRLELAQGLTDILVETYHNESILHIISQVQAIDQTIRCTTRPLSKHTKAESDGEPDAEALRAAAKDAQARNRKEQDKKKRRMNSELESEWTKKFGVWNHDDQAPNPEWFKSLKSKSGYRGVTREQRGTKKKLQWRATLCQVNIGRFDTIREACDEYLKAFKKAEKVRVEKNI